MNTVDELSMKAAKFLLLVISAILMWMMLGGCGDMPSKEGKVLSPQDPSISGLGLPRQATNVKILDDTNVWYTFDLKINGVNHTFLCSYHNAATLIK